MRTEVPFRFSLFVLALLLAVPAFAQGLAQPNGITYSWGASTSAAGCLSTSNPPCSWHYDIFIGYGTGQEASTPDNAAPIAGLTYNWNPQTSPLGKNVCAIVKFVEVIGTVTARSGSSNEACFQFPAAPNPPAGVTQAPY